MQLRSISRNMTVPCLQTATQVIPQNLDIMSWALSKNDPENLLEISKTGLDLISFYHGPFKTCLDRTKYRSRYKDVIIEVGHQVAKGFMDELNFRLKT